MTDSKVKLTRSGSVSVVRRSIFFFFRVWPLVSFVANVCKSPVVAKHNCHCMWVLTLKSNLDMLPLHIYALIDYMFLYISASTGQHMYLHSLNAHCLTKEYGSLENSPETIKATIMSIERCFMTEVIAVCFCRMYVDGCLPRSCNIVFYNFAVGQIDTLNIKT